jgi:hypothetical protein
MSETTIILEGTPLILVGILYILGVLVYGIHTVAKLHRRNWPATEGHVIIASVALIAGLLWVVTVPYEVFFKQKD